MYISFEYFIAVVTLAISFTAIFLSWQSYRHSQTVAVREATEKIFREWWGEELRMLRHYFYTDFVPNHLVKVQGKKLTEVAQIVKEDEGRLNKLAYFFDRIGWLGAAGLIDIDYQLGPMQHVLRRVWIVTEPLIKKDRENNPLYYYGFGWLFIRSNRRRKHQAELVGHKFIRPRILGRKKIKSIKKQLQSEENEFRLMIDAILEKNKVANNEIEED